MRGGVKTKWRRYGNKVEPKMWRGNGKLVKDEGRKEVVKTRIMQHKEEFRWRQSVGEASGEIGRCRGEAETEVKARWRKCVRKDDES